MKRNVLPVFLSLVLATSALAGCNNSAQPNSPSTPNPASSAATPAPGTSTADSGTGSQTKSGIKISDRGVYPIVEDKVTLTIFMGQESSVTDYDDNRLTEYMEEMTNVKIDWNLVLSKDREQKLNLMLASNDNMPDAIMGGVSSALLVDYANQGLFIPINDLIEEQGEYLPQVLDQFDGLREIITAPDGNIYSMPNVTESLGNSYPSRMWINQVWLDNLNLPTPTTTDEFADVLRAFRDNDPNQNGKKDEIPMMGSTNGWNSSFDRFLLNSFIHYNEGAPYQIVNGKIEAVYDKPEYREGLRYLEMLISEGLYDTASMTQDLSQFKQLFENEDAALIGATPSGGPTSFGTASSRRRIDYVGLGPLKGPQGVQLAFHNPYAYLLYPNTFVITSASKYPEVAFKWADLLYEPETAKRARWGVPGVDYVEADPGALNGWGEVAQWRAVLAWGSQQNSHWAGYNPTLENFAGRGQKSTDPNAYPKTNDEVTRELYMQYAEPTEMFVPPMMYLPDDSKRLNEINSVLKDYIKETREKFITGRMSLDKDWDSYIKELEKIGYKEYVDIMQKRYDELN